MSTKPVEWLTPLIGNCKDSKDRRPDGIVDRVREPGWDLRSNCSPHDRARLRELSNLQDRGFEGFDETKTDIAPVSGAPLNCRSVFLFGERVEGQLQHYRYLARIRARTCSPGTPCTFPSSISASLRSASSIQSSRIVSGSTESRLRTRAWASRRRARGASSKAAFSISPDCILRPPNHLGRGVRRLSGADKQKVSVFPHILPSRTRRLRRWRTPLETRSRPPSPAASLFGEHRSPGMGRFAMLGVLRCQSLPLPRSQTAADGRKSTAASAWFCVEAATCRSTASAVRSQLEWAIRPGEVQRRRAHAMAERAEHRVD